MSLETQIQSRLASVLPGKVFAVQSPPNTPWPVVVWQTISGVAVTTHESTTDAYQSRVQVDAYASGITAARTLRDAAIAALEGNHSDGPIFVIDESEGYESDAQVYRASADFNVWANN